MIMNPGLYMIITLNIFNIPLSQSNWNKIFPYIDEESVTQGDNGK